MIIISVIHNWNIVESGVKRNNHISDVQICNHNGKIIGSKKLSTQHQVVRAKTGIRIMCSNGATCLAVDCCFSELAL
jgi:hypothetical protein